MSEDIKLWHGDCLELMKDIPDKSIDCIICDLPYGTTACKWDVIIPFDKLWEQYNRIIKDNGVIALFCGEPFTSKLICSNMKMFKYRITWDRMQGSGHLNSKKKPLTQCEDIAIFSKVKLGNSTYNPQIRDKDKSKIRTIGNRNPCSITTYGKHNGRLSKDYDNTKSYPTDLISISGRSCECNTLNRVHPTQKPVALIEYLIKTYSDEGDLILDNTAGSMTTAIAAINTNRRCICIEKDDNYFEIGSERVMKHLQEQQLKLF